MNDVDRSAQHSQSTCGVLTRRAELRDLPHLIEMIRELAAYHGDEASLKEAQLERDLFGYPPWITVLVAEMSGEVVGYSVLCPLIQLQSGARGMDMHHLFVEKAARAKGVGTALVRASVNEARKMECTYLRVGTAQENRAAQGFYLARGFSDASSHSPRFKLRIDQTPPQI